ncbi:hypothetical protein Ddye_015477 [Dipteronia dyeriana]|uniref:Uncharacterized protein n=1 Tax=Dipteronia dyeriana TaxID=168575 RepID=A0AAD9WZ66_9ROSI|nr:hypothetical protein Ddye_015477 [Dipteronia dyeriana]
MIDQGTPSWRAVASLVVSDQKSQNQRGLDGKPLKMDKVEEGAGRVDGTIETATTEVKLDHITSLLVALHAIP